MKQETMLIEINSKNLEALKTFSIMHDLDINQAANKIIEFFLSEIKEKSFNDKEPEKINIVSEIINFYKINYRQRYQIAYYDTINENEVKHFIKNIIKNVGDEATAIEIIKKALIWYIFFHKKIAKDGTHYSAQIYSFIHQSWIFKSCVEQSSEYSLDLLLEAAKKGFEAEELKKFNRSGDSILGGNETFSLQDVLVSIEELADTLGEEIKEVEVFQNLYKGSISKKEIKEAIDLIKIIKEKFNA